MVKIIKLFTFFKLLVKTTFYAFKYGLNNALQFLYIKNSGLFDAEYYKKESNSKLNNDDALLFEFILEGQDKNYNPNEYFETKWYRANVLKKISSSNNPILHYITKAHKTLIPTGLKFDSKIYLKNNPDLIGYEKPLLSHYLKFGKNEGRKVYSIAQKSFLKPKISAPDLHMFDQFENFNDSSPEANVDVIIPVYKGYNDTLNCLFSIYQSKNKTPFSVTVINDCSPDSKLSDALDLLASKQMFNYLKNERNLGFVESVNRGMRAHKKADVILLNSDTEVYNDWLDRLYHHSSKNDVKTITPLSNNATICSYPVWPEDNIIPLELPYSELDLLAKKYNQGFQVEIPTGVGFCMYIKRDALNSFGYFDAIKFGQGYGEENDFSMRVLENGGKNILATDVFVRHTGEVSFAEQSNEKKEKGLNTLLKDYPNYNDLVGEHIKSDPSRIYRQNLDLARISTKKCNTLIITHNWGGGIERYLSDKVKNNNKVGFFILRPNQKNANEFKIDSIDSIHLPNIEKVTFLEDLENWKRWKDAFKINKVEIHSLAGWYDLAVEDVFKWCRELSIEYDFYVHDYLSICPDANFLDNQGEICEISRTCQSCIISKESSYDLSEYRRAYEYLITNASNVYAPSNDTANRIRKEFEIDVIFKPHQENLDKIEPSPKSNLKKGEPINIGIIGAINREKGSEVIDQLVQYSTKNRLNYKFIIIGHTNNESLKKNDNIIISGPYSESDVYGLIKKYKIHLAFFPSVIPETYCFSLSIALKCDLPIIVFNLGAQSERLKNKNDQHLVLPYDIKYNPGKIFKEIDRKFK